MKVAVFTSLVFFIVAIDSYAQYYFMDTSGIIELIFEPSLDKYTLESKYSRNIDFYQLKASYFNNIYTDFYHSDDILMVMSINCLSGKFPELNLELKIDTAQSQLFPLKILEFMNVSEKFQLPVYLFKGDIFSKPSGEIVISFWIEAIGLVHDERPCDRFSFNLPQRCPQLEYPNVILYNVYNSRPLRTNEIEYLSLTRLDLDYIYVRDCHH